MPLTGMRVIEVCSNLAGPVTGTIFGDLGADVIKVEKSNGGDDARGWAPLWNDHGAPFQAINRNKRSVALDFRKAEDVAKLKKLVVDADVFVHNIRPGAAEALGLSGPEMRTLNPRLIYCAIGAYGEQGPWRERSAYDGLAQALSGQMSGNGFPDSEPLLVPGGVVDKGAGMWAAIATLGALVRRARTGEGAIVGTSLLEASLFWRDIGFAHYHATGQTPLPAGNTSVSIVPYGVFPTGDGPVMLACAGDGVFAALAAALDHSEWLQDDRFATNSTRVAYRDIVVPAIEDVLKTRSRDHWIELLGKSRVPCAPILTVAEAHAHPQVQAIGIFQSAPGVDRRVVSAPWRIDGVRPAVRIGAPALGEDNHAVFGEMTWRERED
jgi:crotonobetainyl-CoA:carnitine CoA-transferase CaiB-like acyl-CoA transferase